MGTGRGGFLRPAQRVIIAGSAGSSGALDVNITGNDTMRVEIAATDIGCALDGAGDAIGRVVLCKNVDESTGTETTTLMAYMYDGTTVANYAGPFGPCAVQETGVSNVIHTCKIDDVNGDGSVLIEFVESCFQNVTQDGTVTNTPIGTFTTGKMDVPYTVLGTALLADDVGVDAQTEQNSIVVENGASWSPTQLMCSYVIRVSAVTTGVTFTGSNGITRALALNETISFNSGDEPFDVSPVLTTGAGDVVVITYTTLGA